MSEKGRTAVENAVPIIEGINDDVLYSFLFIVSVAMVSTGVFFRRRQQAAIHPDSETGVNEVRQRLQTTQEEGRDSAAAESSCPVCLGELTYGVETNCGHVFCSICIITYWKTGRWLGAVPCPACRQTVTLMLTAFTSEELANDSEEKSGQLADIRDYNRRFSGEPRSIMEHLRDLPTLLRHLIGFVFTPHGAQLMFRLRVFVMFGLALIYVILPVDILPEAVFGVIGLIDDIFIFLMISIYVASIFRVLVRGDD